MARRYIVEKENRIPNVPPTKQVKKAPLYDFKYNGIITKTDDRIMQDKSATPT